MSSSRVRFWWRRRRRRRLTEPLVSSEVRFKHITNAALECTNYLLKPMPVTYIYTSMWCTTFRSSLTDMVKKFNIYGSRYLFNTYIDQMEKKLIYCRLSSYKLMRSFVDERNVCSAFMHIRRRRVYMRMNKSRKLKKPLQRARAICKLYALIQKRKKKTYWEQGIYFIYLK